MTRLHNIFVTLLKWRGDMIRENTERKKNRWNIRKCTWEKYRRKYIYESESHSVTSDSLWPHELYNPWNSPGQNTRVGSLSLLQRIFPTQGLNPGLPHCKWILYQLIHKGTPRILEWIAYPFSRGSSQPRSWTGVSCIVGGFFTNWAIREAHIYKVFIYITQKKSW